MVAQDTIVMNLMTEEVSSPALYSRVSHLTMKNTVPFSKEVTEHGREERGLPAQSSRCEQQLRDLFHCAFSMRSWALLLWLKNKAK